MKAVPLTRFFPATGIRAATQVRVILTLFVAMLATLIALAPSASAEPALDLELVEIDEWEPELPEIPEHEIVLIDPELLEELPWLFLLTADATIDCADNGAIDVEIGNPQDADPFTFEFEPGETSPLTGWFRFHFQRGQPGQFHRH